MSPDPGTTNQQSVNLNLEISEASHQKLTDLAQQHDLTLAELVEHLLSRASEGQ